MDTLTIEAFKKALPAQTRKSVNTQLLDQINQTLADPDMYDVYRENLLGFTNVLTTGKFKLPNYVKAIKYVSHKLGGRTNADSFAITFPERIQKWTQTGVSKEDMSTYISAYNKSKLVSTIMEQALVPSWLLNQDLYQKALNTQAELMVHANSEKVRSDAANSILTHLKMPETQKVELDIGVKKDSSIDALRQATMALVEEQRKAIASGSMDAKEIAHAKVVMEEREVDGERIA